MFAVVTIGGKQYTVYAGDVIEVDKQDGKAGDTVAYDEVLLVTDGDKTTVGTPTVKGAVVKAKILAQKKGEKLSVRRYKSKVRYRKATGFRASLSQVEITSIGRV